MSNQIKKISLDLHGVINDLPEVFIEINKSLINDGWEIHIITGSTTAKAYGELIELGMAQGVHFTHVVGLPDYCIMKGCKVIGRNDKHGNLEFNSEDWFSMKALYCKENNIMLHMDDQEQYGNDFRNTAFARLYTKNKEEYKFEMYPELYGKTVAFVDEEGVETVRFVWSKSEAIRNKGLDIPIKVELDA